VITVLAGSPGLGKSTLTADLAARLSRGTLTGAPSSALILTGEDPLTRVVRPRLEAAGADLNRVHFGAIKRGGFETPLVLPDNIADLRELVLEHAAELVAIDPLTAHLAGKINSWKDQSVREALAPLHRLADETGAAVIVVAHLNKGQGSDPLDRLGGSIGIPAAARSVLLLARDPDDPEGEVGSRRVLAHVKSNLSEPAPSLALELETKTLDSGVETVAIKQLGVSDYAGSQLLGNDQSRRGSKLLDAIEFLQTILSEGPKPVAEVQAEAERRGISESTLKRAGKQVGIEPRKLGYSEGWAWELREQHNQELAA
jgi:hypothetical protein